MKAGSLFSGIGGIDLGLQKAGFEIAWQVEIDPFCQNVLAKHWPNVERFNDVRTVGKRELGTVDLIAGGFPCQDVSGAGKKAGINGERSGLWFEFLRIIRELRPRFVLVENVRGLLIRGFERVLGDLAESGYDAEWQVLSASQFGYPHQRQRVFIVAYPMCKRLEGRVEAKIFNDMVTEKEISKRELCESDIVRKRSGVPNYVHRIKGLGNSVVPDIAEWIGKQIIKCDHK